jgi:hypothetical protein
MQGRVGVVHGWPGYSNFTFSFWKLAFVVTPICHYSQVSCVAGRTPSTTDCVVCCAICWLFNGAQGTSEMLKGANNNRRLLELAPAHARGLHTARHLHAASPPAKAAAPAPAAPVAASAARREAGAPIPVIADSEAVAENVPPTVSPLMSMQDMLCTVQENSPTRLQGMLLPDKKNTSAGIPIKCGAPPQPTIFRYQQLVFKPVKIPVVFHCELAGPGCRATTVSAAVGSI